MRLLNLYGKTIVFLARMTGWLGLMSHLGSICWHAYKKGHLFTERVATQKKSENQCSLMIVCSRPPNVQKIFHWKKDEKDDLMRMSHTVWLIHLGCGMQQVSGMTTLVLCCFRKWYRSGGGVVFFSLWARCVVSINERRKDTTLALLASAELWMRGRKVGVSPY